MVMMTCEGGTNLDGRQEVGMELDRSERLEQL